MSTISAGTTTGTALAYAADTTGTLQLQINNTTPALTLNLSGAVGVGSTPGYGTSGQLLSSGGTGAAPSWVSASTITAGNVTTNANLTGDVTSVGNATTVVKINGTTLSVLATGLLKNTTSTGVPSIATAGTDYVVPGGALGTPSSGTLSSCTVDGTNAVGYKNVPLVGGAEKAVSYTLVATDVGKVVGLTTSGLAVIPASIFATGDTVAIYNNTATAIAITSSAVTAYIGGTNAVKTSVSLATRGVCTVFFVSASICIITGNVS